MRYAAIALLGIAAFGAQAKDTYVSPHVTKSGNYVQGHYQTAPNETKLDNYSTKGNTNPYTGKAGTVDPYKVDRYSPKPPQAPSIYGAPTGLGKSDD